MLKLSAPLVIVPLCLAGPAALADKQGEQVMKTMDRALMADQDQVMENEMVVQDPGKRPRRLGMRVHTRDTRRKIEFLYPGDVKGLKLLVLSRSQMYIWLPAYSRLRRIASHTRDQSMFGADFSYDEMSTVTYGDVFRGDLIKQDKQHWVVKAKRREGKESPYASIELTIRKDNKLPAKLVYFNARGKKVKTETRSDYRCQKGFCGAWRMKMVDHTRNDHWTEIVRKSWTVNSGFSDAVFSLRRLQRGR